MKPYRSTLWPRMSVAERITHARLADTIIKDELAAHRISHRELVGTCRTAAYVAARRSIARRLAAETQLRLTRIARLLKRDPASVRHLIEPKRVGAPAR